MPMQRCQSGGKPGVKWGSSGKCYTYTPGDKESKARAERLCMAQARAIEASEHGTSNKEEK